MKKPSKFIGDDSANAFYGSLNRDIMKGNGGDDILVGAGGDDRLSGGDGQDVLRGGDGVDVLDGGGGTDLIFGGSGDDRVLAVRGDDFVDGGRGKKDSVAIAAASDAVHVSEIGDFRIIATDDSFITVRNIELFEFDDGLKTLRFFNYLEPYDLIPGSDEFQGGSGRNFLSASYYGPDEGGDVTINDGDQLDGGAGSDVLTIVATKSGSVAPHLQSIETIRVSVVDASFAVDLAQSAGVRTLELGYKSDGTFTAQNVSSIVALQLNGVAGGTLAVEYTVDIISEDSDTQRVTLNDADGAISVTGIEFIDVMSVSSAGQSNTLTIDAPDLHTLNILGEARISIDGFGAATRVIDASLAIGGVELAFTHALDILATGGEADDLFDFTAVPVADAVSDSAGAVVDGGKGDDIVSFAGNAEDATATKDGESWVIAIDGTTVRITSVELLKFADTSILVRDLDNGGLLDQALL